MTKESGSDESAQTDGMTTRDFMSILKSHISQRATNEFRSNELVQFLTASEMIEASLLTESPSPALGNAQWTQLYARDQLSLEANCSAKSEKLERGGPDFLTRAWRSELEVHLWVIGYEWEHLEGMDQEAICELADNPYAR